MNYRHIYHAGNFADVVKHVVLQTLLQHLHNKPKPFCFLDTHAGIGRYPLASDESQKTLEFTRGIGRLYQDPALPAVLAEYVELVRASDPANTAEELAVYPGSPLLARALLRPQDRAVLMELHPADAASLKALFRGDQQVAVHASNGYHGLKAFLPPPERRGLVLIDPPFEATNEFAQIIDGIKKGTQRWPSGIYAIWYPIKDRRATQRFEKELKKTGLANILLTEVCLHPEDLPDRFNGCGMAIINPPWKQDLLLRDVLPILVDYLAEPGQGRYRVEWLAKS